VLVRRLDYSISQTTHGCITTQQNEVTIMLLEHPPTYVFADVGSHGHEKMSITFTLDEWNSIVRHLQNSQKYLYDRSDTGGASWDYKSLRWVCEVAGTIDNKIEKKIIKLSK
jgi:hypothetical protein